MRMRIVLLPATLVELSRMQNTFWTTSHSRSSSAVGQWMMEKLSLMLIIYTTLYLIYILHLITWRSSATNFWKSCHFVCKRMQSRMKYLKWASAMSTIKSSSRRRNWVPDRVSEDIRLTLMSHSESICYFPISLVAVSMTSETWWASTFNGCRCTSLSEKVNLPASTFNGREVQLALRINSTEVGVRLNYYALTFNGLIVSRLIFYCKRNSSNGSLSCTSISVKVRTIVKINSVFAPRKKPTNGN